LSCTHRQLICYFIASRDFIEKGVKQWVWKKEFKNKKIGPRRRLKTGEPKILKIIFFYGFVKMVGCHSNHLHSHYREEYMILRIRRLKKRKTKILLFHYLGVVS
jgi:hypothetical protein